MNRLSILSLMLLILLAAVFLALFVRLREETIFYVMGPFLGAALAALTYPHDLSALITGGAIGGLAQGIIAMMVFKRGYLFPDLITADGYLVSLAVHLFLGFGFGLLLFLLKQAHPARTPNAET
jgi:hypothetical protein